VPRAPVLLVALALVLVSCVHQENAPSYTSSPAYRAVARFTSSTGDAVLHVAIARTEAEQRRGLMHITSLPENDGMAFVWDSPTQAAFWMKDTLIPLSIAFVDDGVRIVTIRDMPPCTADPCPSYGSRAPFVTAIEANRGWFDDHGVGVGDRVALETPA
jgi:hypothetical protein